MSFEITKCDCGFGDGFYHFGPDSTHEFNPGVSEEAATEDYYDDRKPVAVFYGYKDGRSAVLQYNEGEKKESFNYSEYGNKPASFVAIVNRIKELWQQPSLF